MPAKAFLRLVVAGIGRWVEIAQIQSGWAFSRKRWTIGAQQVDLPHADAVKPDGGLRGIQMRRQGPVARIEHAGQFGPKPTPIFARREGFVS